MHTFDRLPACYSLHFEFVYFIKSWTGDMQTCNHGTLLATAQTEIIRAITPASKAYLLEISMKNALRSLIGSVGCCNPSTQLVLISLVQTAQLDMYLSYLSERKDTAERAWWLKNRPEASTHFPIISACAWASARFCWLSAYEEAPDTNRSLLYSRILWRRLLGARVWDVLYENMKSRLSSFYRDGR